MNLKVKVKSAIVIHIYLFIKEITLF